MVKLLYLSDIFDKTFYTVAKNESLLDIALRVGVPPHFLILDNGLNCEPTVGDVLIIKKRGQMKCLSFDDIQVLSDSEKNQIMLKNGITFLYVGQLII